jgi:hypothetical protein
MPTIVIVDDDNDAGETYKTIIKGALIQLHINGWICKVIQPFKKKEQYKDFTLSHPDTAVFLLDFHFANYDYTGEDLAAYLRGQSSEFPIYIMSAYGPSTSNSIVEAVFTKGEFQKDFRMWIPRITRAGMRFLDAHKKELDELGKLAKKIAIGRATKADQKRLSALQTKIQLPCPSLDSPYPQTLKKLEEEVLKLEKLLSKVGGQKGK